MMKKRPLIAALALTLALTLAACGGEEVKESQGQPDPGTQASQASGETDAGYVFKSGANEVAINADMADVLAALGEPQNYFEAESCAFKGLDKTYTYSGFVITTRPDEEKDYVNSIVLTSDNVTTPEGIYIGQSADDVTAAYGASGDATDNYLRYTKGGVTLSFILEGGKIVSIEYLPE